MKTKAEIKKILIDWFKEHLLKPNPSWAQCADLAKETGKSLDSVYYWFRNFRSVRTTNVNLIQRHQDDWAQWLMAKGYKEDDAWKIIEGALATDKDKDN